MAFNVSAEQNWQYHDGDRFIGGNRVNLEETIQLPQVTVKVRKIDIKTNGQLTILNELVICSLTINED